MKFYKCAHCGNVAVKLVDSSVPLVCCGQAMDELVPNTTDAATEKHVPVLTRNGDSVTVKVFTVEHPMTEAHWITFIAIETETGYQLVNLAPTDKPEATFHCPSKVVKVYEYCNLHGLWSAEGE